MSVRPEYRRRARMARLAELEQRAAAENLSLVSYERGDGSTPGLVAWGRQWAQWHGFELSDEVAGEIGFLYWHAGARTSKDKDADHLIQHAREHGRGIRRAPKAEPEEEVTPFDWETEDAKTRAGVVNRRARKF